VSADPTADVAISADADTKFFWEGTANGRLLAQRCKSCARLWHPPGPVCPHCQCLEWTIEELPRVGTIYSVARVHEPGSPIQGTHYLIGLVDVADPRSGPDTVRLACNIRGATLDDAVIGAAVELCFEDLADGYRLPQFRV
jgi:uncharacterized protein